MPSTRRSSRCSPAGPSIPSSPRCWTTSPSWCCPRLRCHPSAASRRRPGRHGLARFRPRIRVRAGPRIERARRQGLLPGDRLRLQPLDDLGTPSGPPAVGGQVVAHDGVVLAQGLEAGAFVELVLQRVDLLELVGARGVGVDAIAAVDDAHTGGLAARDDLGGDDDRAVHGLLRTAVLLHLARGGGELVADHEIDGTREADGGRPACRSGELADDIEPVTVENLR